MQLTALSFSKEGHCIVELARLVKRSIPTSWQVITQQVMGRSVKRRLELALSGRAQS